MARGLVTESVSHTDGWTRRNGGMSWWKDGVQPLTHNVMSMWSLRWHFTNKSVTGAPYSIKGYSYSYITSAEHTVMEYSADQENAAAGSLQRLDGLSVCDVLCGHAVHGHDSVVQPTPQRTLLQLPYTRQQLTYSHIHTFFQDYPRWASTRKVKPIWILLKKETEWVAVA